MTDEIRENTKAIIIMVTLAFMVLFATYVYDIYQQPQNNGNNINFQDMYVSEYSTDDGLVINLLYQCGDSCNEHTEIYGWYAKGVYVNCTIITKGLESYDVYRNFLINDTLQGDIINNPLYRVHMNDVIHISNEMNKPIICDKFDYVRDSDIFLSYDVNQFTSTIYNTEGQYCYKDIRKYDYSYVHDMCSIQCCVDEYCAIYAQNLYEYVSCDCDNSLNITPSKVYLCSNFKDDVINCS